MKKTLLTLAVTLLCTQPTAATTSNKTDDGAWETAFYALMDGEDADAEAWEATFDLLSQLEQQPINLNQATREQLEQMPFLTAAQVEGILEYVYRHGPLKTVGELQMVESLDRQRRLLLNYFTYVGEPASRAEVPSLKTILNRGRQQLTATVRIPTYERQGDRNGYLGYPYKHWLRYEFNCGQQVRFGLTAAQDAGEPFFANRNKTGYDHYAYYLQLRRIGRLEALLLGTYRVQFGMGLVANTGFAPGKLATLESLGRSSQALQAHSSRLTDGYFNGAAATIRIGRRWTTTAFASYRPIDATLNDDGTARTLVTTGYHRTPTEMAKKHNTHIAATGGSLRYYGEGWQAGLNGVYSHLDRDLQPLQTQRFRRYYARGNDFLNVSADYRWTRPAFSFSGETAINHAGALALIHSLSLTPSSALSLMLLHRYYDKRYTSLYARSLSAGTSVQNENGVYVGAEWQATKQWRLWWYADYAHFPWIRYRASAPSDAFETMLALRWQRLHWTVQGRYRFRLQQQDNSSHTLLQNRLLHRARLAATYHDDGRLSLQTQLDASIADNEQQQRGWMVSEQATWQLRRLQLSATVGYFHTDSYEARLYLYEKAMLYTFSNQMLYGRGLRYALFARADIGQHWTLTGKVGVTDYFDRSSISSGLQQIDASSMCDIDVQLRWKF